MTTETKATTTPDIVKAVLGGRCANGFEGGAGTLIHALPRVGAIALCGTTYGRRSAGWFEVSSDAVVTCPRCARRLTVNRLS